MLLAVSHLVARFNAEGLAALSPRHGGGLTRTHEGIRQSPKKRIVAQAQIAYALM
jgi:hypothetical protein